MTCQLPPGCRVLKRGSELALPYRSRDPKGFHRLLERAWVLECPDGRRVLLAVSCTGFPPRRLCCLASEVALRLERVRVYDRLSGLTLTLQAPVILLDGCEVRSEWDGSRFKIECEALRRCCSGYSSGSSMP